MKDDDGGRWRAMDYGFNYIPTVALVEHFVPFWVADGVTAAQMRRDLLAMRALNARFVRFHLYPADPRRDSLPGADPEASVAAMDEAMAFADEIGLSVHLDIWSANILDITPEQVAAIVRRTGGFVDSWQIGNEAYFAWAQDDKYFRHLRRLIEAGKAARPGAKFSTDIFPADLADLRGRMPDLYDMLDMVPIHFYATSDQRGWQEVYVEQLVSFCGGRDNHFQELRDERFVQSEFYVGSYGGFEKPRWITEITGAGYHRFSNLAGDEVKAAGWRKVCRALAERTDVVRVGHHCFRDKMSWREFGQSQCGAVGVDCVPKPLAAAFAEMAGRSLPEDDLARWVKVAVEAGGGRVEVRLDSRLDRAVAGRVTFETTGDLSAAGGAVAVAIPAGGTARCGAALEQARPPAGAASHVFARFDAEGAGLPRGPVVGWCVVSRPRPVAVDTAIAPFEGVRYVGGVEAVAAFFRRHPAPVVVFGKALGFDAEMGYRLKCVLQRVGGRAIDVACAADARPMLDRPAIILGGAERNFYAALVESAADPACRVGPEGPSVVAVIDRPFAYQDRRSAVSGAIGYAYCPACLYIAGADDEALRRAVYDVVRRVWGEALPAVGEVLRGRHPVCGARPRTFRVDLDPGPYRVSLTVGQRGDQRHLTAAGLSGGGQVGPVATIGEPRTVSAAAEVSGGRLEVALRSEPGSDWAIAALEIAHTDLLAEYRHFIFTTRPEEESVSGNELPVGESDAYAPRAGYGWVD